MGYLRINLCANGKCKKVRVHRLIAQTFLSNPAGLPEVNHKDGVKHHNWPENLEWSTCSDNVQHAYDTGLKVAPRGQDCNFSKLTEEKVLEIRRLFDTGKYLQSELADRLEISRATMNKIVKRKTWKHI